VRTRAEADRPQIAAVLKKVSDAWLRGTPENLPDAVKGCFHDDVIFRGANFQVVAHGVPAAIASFQGFMRTATISSCRLGKPQIDVAGDTAIATFQWEMAYRFGDSEHHETGYEIDVLTRSGAGQWLIRWRTLVLTPRTSL
jgi:ketosteroid isomerase-like protein